MASALHLTSEQESQIATAASPLPPALRNRLRERVLAELEAASEIGDGLTYRVCRAVQRELFMPPGDIGNTGAPRHFRKVR